MRDLLKDVNERVNRYRKTAAYRLRLKFGDIPENYDPFLVDIPTEWGQLNGYPGIILKAEDSPFQGVDATLVWCYFYKGATFPEHYHLSYTETVTILSGHIIATLDGEKMSLRAGTGFVAHIHQIHGYEAMEDTLLALAFTPSLIRSDEV